MIKLNVLCKVKDKTSTIKCMSLLDLLKYGYSVVLLMVFLICISFDKIKYANKRVGLIESNAILLFIGAIILTLVYILASKVATGGVKSVIVFGIIFVVMQSFIIENYYFITRWDVAHVFHTAEAVALQHFDYLSKEVLYFSFFPNNLLLAYLFSCIIKIANLFGFNSNYFSLICFQCLCSGIIGVIVYLIIIDLSNNNKNQAFFAFIVYILLIGLSPWISVPYSDSVGLIFPALLLYVYIKAIRSKPEDKKTVFKWMLIGFITLVALRIKPQSCIIGISILLIELLSVKYKEFQRLGSQFLCFAIGMCIASALSTVAIESMGIERDDERTIGVTHFLMMGLNEKTNGAFYYNDSVYSGKILNKKKRAHENLRIAINRVRTYKAYGLFKHLCKKTLTNFNDGTYCWGGEGQFYDGVLPANNNNKISVFLRNVYYNKHLEGKYYKIWSDFVQSIWIAILGLSVLMSFVKRNKVFMCISLSLFGLWLFEILFEARARYLFSNVPIFIIAGSFGMEMICIFVKKKLLKKRISGC